MIPLGVLAPFGPCPGQIPPGGTARFDVGRGVSVIGCIVP